MYPSRALGHAFSSALLGVPVAAFLAWGSFRLLHAYLSVTYAMTPWLVLPFWVVVFFGLWCEGMYQDVRGWSISQWGD